MHPITVSMLTNRILSHLTKVYLALIGLMIPITYTAQAQAQLLCSTLFSESINLEEVRKSLGPDLPNLISRISSLPVPVVSGRQKPTWDDFDQLEKILEDVKKIKNVFRDRPNARQEIHLLAQELQKEMVSSPFFIDFKKAVNSPLDTKAYLPTEYELKRAYQFYLARLNKELPRELRIPHKRIPLDSRREQIIAEAKKTSKELEVAFEKIFLTADSSNYAAFEAELRASTNPLVIKALQMIDNDQIQVVIRRPEAGRFWIPKTGFQNQFVTGSSKGSLDPFGRNSAENKMYNFDNMEIYAAKDPEFKPKYGTLRANSQSGVVSSLSKTYWYGGDIYTLKIEQLKDRLSWFPMDSLGIGKRIPKNGQKEWDDLFIPWSYRLLMVPLMIRDLGQNQMNAGQISEDFPNVFNRTSYYFKVSSNYWEAQILGSLTIRDVAELEFTQTPPSGEFLSQLRKYNIKIRDGRTQPAVDWTGE